MIDRRNVSNLYPLSSLQEGMLYHALREPQSRAYFEQIDFEISDALDVTAYLQAWQDLVDRHDILRTVFAVRKLPQPLQIVLRSAPLATVQQDLRAMNEEAAQNVIAHYRTADLGNGFDLTEQVPMRIALFTLSENRHRVVWSFHHILLDGWSLALLQADLDALYAAGIAGRRAQLPPPAPYSAYIKWLGKRERQEGLAFWRKRLQGLDLPTPIPRRLDARFTRDVPPYSAGECRHPLAIDAQEGLTRLATRHGVTVNIVVQCLWGMLLGRLNGRRDAAFAATVSGRPMDLERADSTVGLFINAVPVRIRWQDGETFADLLARTQTDAIDAQAFHDCPLAEVQAGHALRDTLFDHILVFENYPQLEKPAQEATAVNLHEYTHYDVEFQFLPGAPSVLRFRFHAGLFDAAQIASIARDFESLLLNACAAPHTPVEQLALPPRNWKAPARLAVAASFTAEPAAESLQWWLAQFACPTQVELAPYNQCVQQLGDVHSVLRQAELGVLLLRFADAARDLADMPIDEACASLDAQCGMLLSLLEQCKDKPLIVGLLPSAQDATPLSEHVQSLEQRWEQALRALPDVRVIDLRRLATDHFLDEIFDPTADRIGHLPYSPPAFDAIAAGIARAAIAQARPPFKVIAVDCDNTLWAGVCGEVGPLGVRIDAGHRALQEFLVERQQQGFLIALASKNREEDVWAVFERNPGMVLRREHVAAAAINWLPKSDNLRQLAAGLNLGVDSIVFLDDSPLECSEVMENCPQALAIPLPTDSASYAAWLARIWAFDLIAVTAEDRERTGMMAAEAQRQAALNDKQSNDSQTDPQAFLAQLQLRVKVGPVQPHQIARVAQLTQRTNQFNLSGKRRSEAEIAALIADPGVSVLAVEVDDRFGAYGLTGVAIARNAGTFQLDTLLLSCRVLGRRVEYALLNALARRADALGHHLIEAPLVITERNDPVRLFLSRSPWTQTIEHRYSCAVLACLRSVDGMELLNDHVFTPSRTSIPPAAFSARPNVGPSNATSTAQRLAPFPMPIRNLCQLVHGTQYLPLLAACAGWPQARLRASTQKSSAAYKGKGRIPTAGTEQAVAAIWAEVLGNDVTDAEAGFAELGGHSLLAVRAVSRIERAFNRELGLAQFFSLSSVAALAAWLDQPATQAGALAMSMAAPVAEAPDAPSYPLSHNQQRLWILNRMGAADNTYNLCAAFQLHGPLDVAALEASVHHLVRRHEVLRTVFRTEDDQPRQVILADQPAAFLLGAPATTIDPADAIRTHIVARSRIPFDLDTGPLFQAELHSIDAGNHVLAIYLHHIIGDGWSFGLLLDDLARTYARATGATLSDDDAIPRRYRDFAVWNRSDAYESWLARQRAYWQRQLLPLTTIATIAPDFPRAAMPGDGGVITQTVLVSLPVLREWLQQHDANLFPLLASLVALLLYRCSGESTVRLGMPVAGRDRPEFEKTVGFFANTSVLAAWLANQAGFTELLNDMQQRVNGALEHQAYPFDRLVADTQPEREPGRNPLFDVMVALQNARTSSAALPGIDVRDFPVDTGLAAFDLVFEFGENTDSELVCALRYRRDLYREETAARLLERLMTLFNSVLAAPTIPLHDLNMIGPREQAQLDMFSRGETRPVPEHTLATLFAQQAARSPDAVALIADGLKLDYRTLDRRANALAWHLRHNCGVADGHVVGVMLERGMDWPVALLGVLKAGAVYLPLDVRHPISRLHELLVRADAHTLIAAPANLLQFSLPNLRKMIPLPDSAQKDLTPATSITVNSPAYLIFTSGSTGVPKGVLVQHRAFGNMIMEQIRGFAIAPGDRILHLASCAFDASLSEFFMAWLRGAGVIVADHVSTRDSALLARVIKEHHATVATITPSHLRQLEDADIAGLRKVILAGEAVLGRDARRLLERGIECFNAYGPTETAVCATLARVTETASDMAPIPIGKPLANLSLRIVDTAAHDLPPGVAGEIVVLGTGVALGYLHASEEANAAFFTLEDGTRGYRTGDIGRWLDDGQIEYLGRKDLQLKIRGHRIDPGEIAAALRAVDGVRQAEVVAELGEHGLFLIAYLCGDPRPDAALRTALGATLPTHMLPARFVWLERLPLTTSGKLDKAALPSLVPRTQPNVPKTAPPSAPEATLLAIWRAILPGEIDIDTDFFAAGGNSLLAMSGARKIARHINRPCAALQFFQTPTVRSMAAALSLQGPICQPLLQKLGKGDLQVFALPPDPGMSIAYAQLSRAMPELTIHAAAFVDQPIDALLDTYADAFESLNLGPDTVLLGYSAGGKLALALAHTLEQRGKRVAKVVLIDAWNWSQADPDVRRRIDQEMEAVLPSSDAALSAAYRTHLSAFEPRHEIAAQIHHLLADIGTDALPARVERNWRGLTTQGYYERRLTAGHHQLLNGEHVQGTAAGLRRELGIA